MYLESFVKSFDVYFIVDACVKMILALLCGGAVGIERGRKKRPAGFRTYMLVCLGATLVMMTNDYICRIYGTGDVARMGAQVVNGIGFLGAGTIITTGHNRVKGLTTAAGLWASACIGLAIGSGYYAGAIIGTFMMVVVMVLLHGLDRRLVANTKVLLLYIEFQKLSMIRKFNTFAKDNHITVEDIEMEKSSSVEEAKVAAVVSLRLPSRSGHTEIVETIGDLEGILFVEEIN